MTGIPAICDVTGEVRGHEWVRGEPGVRVCPGEGHTGETGEQETGRETGEGGQAGGHCHVMHAHLWGGESNY